MIIYIPQIVLMQLLIPVKFRSRLDYRVKTDPGVIFINIIWIFSASVWNFILGILIDYDMI